MALDRQVAVDADLSYVIEMLKNSTTQLKTTAEALLYLVAIQQHNFERLSAEHSIVQLFCALFKCQHKMPKRLCKCLGCS
nr:hypothetical protein [Nostoc sp. ChiQUE02]MDZ8232710.1 hypothetical protein [Nostoc sp. ChiQUE02]